MFVSVSQLGQLLELIGRQPDESVVISSQAAGGSGGLMIDWATAQTCDALIDAMSGRSVWFGIQPVRSVESGRGKANDIVGVDCIYVDIDFKSEKKPLGVDPMDAISIIDDLTSMIGSGPIAIVATGHGIQPYWRLAERLDPIPGAEMMLRWRRMVIKVMATYGAKPDGVFDLSRIFRAPGPDNVKHGLEHAKPTGLSVRDGSPVAIDALMAALDTYAREITVEERTQRAQQDFEGSYVEGGCQPVQALEWSALRAARREDPDEPSAHRAVVGKIMALVTFEQAGHVGATAAIDAVGRQFVETVSDRLSVVDAEDEFDRMVDTAHDKISRDPRIDNPFAEVPAGYVSSATSCCITLEARAKPGSGERKKGSSLGKPDPEQVFLSEEFWASRPVFEHLLQVAKSSLQSPEGVLVSAIALALAHTAPNVVLPACVGVEASLNLMTVLCGGSGDGKSVCRKLAAQALHFAHAPELWTFNPSSGQGVAGQYQYLKKERGAAPKMVRSRYSALAVVEESDTIAALSSNPNSTLSSELRKAAMGESLGFGNVGDTQTNLEEHDYRFVLMMCMQPELAGWLLGDSAGGLPQRFLWACVRDTRVWEGQKHPGVMEIVVPIEGRLNPAQSQVTEAELKAAADRGEKVNVFSPIAYPRPRYVMKVSDRIRNEVVQAAIVRKKRGDEAGVEFDGHAILARLKVAAGLSILSGGIDISDDDWELSNHILLMSNASRSWVQTRVADAAIRANVRLSQAKAHGRIVEESVVEKEARGRCNKKILVFLERAGQFGLTKAELRGKLQQNERHLLDDGVLDDLLGTGLVRFEDIFRGERQVGSRWFRVV